MKIILYTITDCQFSQEEKNYLMTNNLPFEEKNLETNREFLTEMLAVSNNFAGTPVTKIEKDDGQIVVLKGFTKDEFDKTFGFEQQTAPVAAEPAPMQVAPQQAVPVDVAPVPQPMTTYVQPQMPAMPPAVEPAPMQAAPQPAVPVDVAPVPQPMTTYVQPQMPAMPPAVEPAPMQAAPQPAAPVDVAPVPQPMTTYVQPQMPAMPPAQDQALNDILNNLQSKVATDATNTNIPQQPVVDPGTTASNY